MRADIERQMGSFDSTKGDRIDPVAVVCRLLYLRGELCPCRYPRAAASFPDGCMQCQNERNLIEKAWDASSAPDCMCRQGERCEKWCKRKLRT